MPDLTQKLADGIVQHDLGSADPRARGGRYVRDSYGLDYLRHLAATGGQTTLARYGTEYMRKLASKGGKARRKKADTQPRTVKHWDGTVQRHIPYRSPRSRRRRPDTIRILIAPEDANF